MICKEERKENGNKLQFFSENENKGDLTFFFCKSLTPTNTKWKLSINRKREKEIIELELVPNKYIAVNGKFRFRVSNEEEQIEKKKENNCDLLIFYYQKDYFGFFDEIPKTIKSLIFSFVSLSDLGNIKMTCKTNLQIINFYDSSIYKPFLIQFFGEQICSKKDENLSYFQYLGSLFVSKQTKSKFNQILNEIIHTEKLFVQGITTFYKNLPLLIQKTPNEKLLIQSSVNLKVKKKKFLLFLFFIFIYLFILIFLNRT